MIAVDKPWWLRFSERAFSFNFIAFSFVMFSCWFPTGFSATFSTFAFLFALPLFFSRVDWAGRGSALVLSEPPKLAPRPNEAK